MHEFKNAFLDELKGNESSYEGKMMSDRDFHDCTFKPTWPRREHESSAGIISKMLEITQFKAEKPQNIQWGS